MSHDDKSLLEKAKQESGDGKNLDDNDVQTIVDKFVNSLDFPAKKPVKQLILCPTGLVGAGKTTVIKPLSERLSLLRISTDEIRKILHDNGYNYLRTTEICLLVISKHLDDGYSLAMDFDCVGPEAERYIEKIKSEGTIGVVRVHIDPPESFILNKLTNFKHSWLFRDADDAVANYYRRKPLHDEYLSGIEFDYVFDTSKPDLSNQIDGFLKICSKSGKLPS